MVRNDLEQYNRSAIIGGIMVFIGLMFLLYMGSLLIGMTRKYHIVYTGNTVEMVQR